MSYTRLMYNIKPHSNGQMQTLDFKFDHIQSTYWSVTLSICGQLWWVMHQNNPYISWNKLNAKMCMIILIYNNQNAHINYDSLFFFNYQYLALSRIHCHLASFCHILYGKIVFHSKMKQ